MRGPATQTARHRTVYGSPCTPNHKNTISKHACQARSLVNGESLWAMPVRQTLKSNRVQFLGNTLSNGDLSRFSEFVPGGGRLCERTAPQEHRPRMDASVNVERIMRTDSGPGSRAGHGAGNVFAAKTGCGLNPGLAAGRGRTRRRVARESRFSRRPWSGSRQLRAWIRPWRHRR